MKRAFVTGGTGFLGCNLLHRLDAQGWDTHALVRKTSNRQHLPRRTHLVEGALLDGEGLEQLVPAGVDAVFHVAGNTSLWRRNNGQQYQDNVTGTINMLRAAEARGVRRFVYTSSVAAFGFQSTTILNEATPSIAADDWISYNKTKYLAECEVLEAAGRGLEAVVLNPCHIVGRYDTANWARLIALAYRNELPGVPTGVGMFCHVGDVVDAHIAAYERGRSGERYLLGGEEASFLEFLNVLHKILGRPPIKRATPLWLLRLALLRDNIKSLFLKAEPDLTPEKFQIVTQTIRCDYSKAVAELGFRSAPLEVMVRDSLEWLLAEGVVA